MLKVARSLLFGFGLLGFIVHASGSEVSVNASDMASSNRILVRFKGDARQLVAAARAIEAIGGKIVRRFEMVDGLHLVELPASVELGGAIKRLMADPNVLYAEPDHRRRLLDVPNDPDYDLQWAPPIMHCEEAWSITHGSDQVVVAVMDTGIWYPHEDLEANMWMNPGEMPPLGVPDDGKDDDRNGYPDDVYGIDPADHDSDPLGVHYHGTHVSGIIGAVGNNGEGMAGVNWTVRLMALKVFDAAGWAFDSYLLEAMQYVIDMKGRGVKIVALNVSLGGGDWTPAWRDAIDALGKAGVLFVAAAANDQRDNDVQAKYPADFQLPNVISVAATGDQDGFTSAFSNWGSHTVHVGAPGKEIYSTMPNDGYAEKSGTSMAAPHVCGVIALEKAADPALDWIGLKNLVISAGSPRPSLADKVISGNRIDALGSLTCSSRQVLNRTWPPSSQLVATPGEQIPLRVLSIDCAAGYDPGNLWVETPNISIRLWDDGQGPDQAALDGTFSAEWSVPDAPGTYALAFPHIGGASDSTDIVVPPPPYRANFLVMPSLYEVFAGRKLTLAHSQYDGEKYAEITGVPFALNLGGASFTVPRVHASGTITFNLGVNGTSSPRIPIPEEADSLVGVFMDDMLFKGEGGAYYEVLGSAPNRKLVVEWRNIRSTFCEDVPSQVTFQAVFSEGSTDIVLNYKDLDFAAPCSDHSKGKWASIGLQIGQIGSQFSYLEPIIDNGFSVLCKFGCPDISLGPEALPPASAGAPYLQTLVASAGSGPYTYIVAQGSLPPGLTLDEATGALAGLPNEIGSFSFWATALNSAQCGASRLYTLAVVSCPEISLLPDTLPAGHGGEGYLQQLTASGGIPPYVFAVEAGALPDGLSLDPTTAVLFGYPTATGVFNFAIRATDSSGCTGRKTYDLTITAPCEPINLEPQSIPDAVVGEGYQVVFSAQGGTPPFSYALSLGTLPGSLTLDQSTGVLSGVTTEKEIGSYLFAVTVTDAYDCTGSRPYLLKVTAKPCMEMTITPEALPTATVGVAFTVTLGVQGGSPPYSFGVADGALPSGFSLDEHSGVITGTPETVGVSLFVIRATDAAGCPELKPYVIQVLPPGCPPISLSPNDLLPAQLGEPYSATIVADGGSPPYSLSVALGLLPAGLSFDAASGAITGTPLQAGSYVFAITATDAGGCQGSRAYEIAVNSPRCPAISLTPTVLPDGDPGERYEQVLSAAGGDAPYTFDITMGTLPPGLTLDREGRLTGTPTAAGMYAFVISATDAKGCSGTGVYMISMSDTAGATADLLVVLDHAPRLLSGGRSVRAAFHCVNQGQAGAGPSRTEVYLSKNPVLGRKDVLIAATPIPDLDVGVSSSKVKLRYTARRSIEGWYLIFKADAGGALAESTESNNILTVKLLH